MALACPPANAVARGVDQRIERRVSLAVVNDEVRALSMVVVLVVATSSCAAVVVKAPIPLERQTVAVSGSVAVTGGQIPDFDVLEAHVVLQAAPSVTWQAVRIKNIAIELDAGLGGGVLNGFPAFQVHAGAGFGARAWFVTPGWVLGAEFGSAVVVEPLASQAGIPRGFLQLEARGLGAFAVDDEWWLGARPGVFVPVRDGTAPVPLISVPVSLTWSSDDVRVTLEAGVFGPLVPSGIHAGVAAAYLF
jgi:hypothetical protein